MSQADTQAGLVQDFAKLASRGSGDQVLGACATLLSLGPVGLAVEGGASGAAASRTLLEMVASHANDSQKFVRAAAVLTGIDPPDTGRGVRSEPGPGQRQKRAGAILGLGERAVRDNRRRYFDEYAGAVLSFVRAVSRDAGLMENYLMMCGADVATAGRTPVPATAPFIMPSADASIGSDSRYARLMPLSGRVRPALEAARDVCAAHQRAFYTPDLLLVLLDMPRSRTADCFEEVQAGLTRRVREWLHDGLREMNPVQVDPFQPLEWIERPDVQVAQDLAALDTSPAVTEIYLLLGILGSESSTRGRLAKFLGSDDYDRLCAVANARRLHPPDVLRTPGPG